jgi:hypothetical protein
MNLHAMMLHAVVVHESHKHRLDGLLHAARHAAALDSMHMLFIILINVRSTTQACEPCEATHLMRVAGDIM